MVRTLLPHVDLFSASSVFAVAVRTNFVVFCFCFCAVAVLIRFFCAWLMRMSGEICVLTMRFGKAFSRMHLDQRFSELRR